MKGFVIAGAAISALSAGCFQMAAGGVFLGLFLATGGAALVVWLAAIVDAPKGAGA